jgi:hypothetical protein
MFSLFKKKQTKTPEWASFFNDKQYNAFIKALDGYFYKKNITYTLGEGSLTAGPNDFGLGVHGLANVAQKCKLDAENAYPEIIAEHFDSLARIAEFDKEFKNSITDFHKVSQYIGVRLYPGDYADSVGRDRTLGKDFAGDIYAMLVFDLPESVQSILPEQTEKWGKDFDELFKTGIKNIKEKYPVAISEEGLADLKIWFGQGGHFFVPNIVFDFETLQKYSGKYGSLVGIPHRHVAIIYPIENIEVVTAITSLIPVISGMYKEGPGSVSDNIFWYKNGVFENLPYSIADGNIQLSPPENFLNMLNDLGDGLPVE